jgi:hypothetical protein
MFVPAALEDRHQGENDERESDKGEQNMAGQHWKIDRRQPAAKAGRFFADVDVISDVANEKKGGRNHRGDHADDVALPKIAPDEIPASRDENGADKIERGVDCG